MKIAPTSLVIFGVTGDLAQRKLFPALLSLHAKKMLPEKCQIIGFSRRPFTNEEFRTFVREALNSKNNSHSNEQIEAFLSLVIYQQGFFDIPESYQNLGKTLLEVDEKFSACANKLFYLSVPPTLYEGIFYQLSDSGLTIPCINGEGWTRVLVEKPFGRDLKTAQKLDALLAKLFTEKQIFRMDHYLAKETLQNILAFRFENALFESLWNAKNIDSVEVKILEKIDLEGRGAFYDDVGALRDIGQNHLLQMLALVAMENPGKISADSVRRERAKVFKKLAPMNAKNIVSRVVRAQYEGFRNDKGVKPNSETETYFSLRCFIKNKRWKGVPFILETGKALNESKAEIVLNFKSRNEHKNSLTFRIQPDEGISVQFWVKKPGFQSEVEAQDLSYLYKTRSEAISLPDAYEKVLFDCVRGDQMLFASSEEISASWKFITPILDLWKKIPLVLYPKGMNSKEIQ